MPRHLDLDAWPRRAAYHFFRGYDNPYFNVCAPVDATALVAHARATPGVPFSLAALYLALRAANDCEPFRWRLDGDRVLVHDRLNAGTTRLIGDERMVFVYYDHQDDFAAFREGAERENRRVEAAADRIEARDDRSDLVHFSSLPWVSFTSISHARNWGRDDSVPKITFGKYHAADGGIRLPVSVEVHHALMDGVHVARWLERFQALLAAPEAALGSTRP